jgi:hypothetical protein
VESRIPASERTSQKLNELLTEGVADGDARAELLKLAVRKIMEEALEAEVSEALGRGYYENGAELGRGYRNGYRRGRLRTAEGPIDYGVPQVRDRAEPFVSRVRAGLAGRTAELERLAVEMSVACIIDTYGGRHNPPSPGGPKTKALCSALPFLPVGIRPTLRTSFFRSGPMASGCRGLPGFGTTRPPVSRRVSPVARARIVAKQVGWSFGEGQDWQCGS